MGGGEERLSLGGGVEMVYRDNRRQAPALLLFHGLFDHRGTWDLLWPLLGERFRLVAPDLIGFGQSSKPRLPGQLRPYSLEMHAAHLGRLIAHLGLDSLVLGGNSLGGALALYLWHACPGLRPAIRGLVLIDPACYPQPLPGYVGLMAGWPGALLDRAPVRWLAFRLGVVQRLVSRTMARAFFDPQNIPPALRQAAVDNLRAPGVFYSYRAAARHLVPADCEALIRAYRQIACPVLVLWGKEDRIIPPEFARRLQEDLPHAEVHLLEQCGHAPQLERPEQVAGLLNAWAQRHL